jgi:integrase/recombinase XerD
VIPAELTIEAFKEHLLALKSRRTAVTYTRHAGRFRTWIDDEKIDLATARPAFFDDYVEHLKANSLSPSTIRVSCVAARTYIDWLRRNDVEMPDFLKALVPAKKTPENAVVLSDAAVQAFLNYVDQLDEPYRMALLLLYATGARSFEVCGVKLSDISAVESNDDLHYVIAFTGKGDKLRTVPLPVEYRGILRDYLAGWRAEKYESKASPWLFPGRGSNLKERTVREHMQTVRRDLGIDKLTAHVLRKTYSTHLSTHGMPPFMIVQLIGHVTDQTLNFRVASEHYINHALDAIVRSLGEIPFQTPETE